MKGKDVRSIGVCLKNGQVFARSHQWAERRIHGPLRKLLLELFKSGCRQESNQNFKTMAYACHRFEKNAARRMR